MDAAIGPSIRERSVRRAYVACNAPAAVARLKSGLGPGPFALVALFVSPRSDFERVVTDARAAFGSAEVIACTTAGEITDRGYADGTIVAVGFPAADFAAKLVVVPDLSDVSHPALIDRVTTTRAELAREHAVFQEEFAFLMVDGLSRMEDQLTATLAMGLGSTPIFGGSAGDGADFRKTLVSAGGAHVAQRRRRGAGAHGLPGEGLQDRPPPPHRHAHGRHRGRPGTAPGARDQRRAGRARVRPHPRQGPRAAHHIHLRRPSSGGADGRAALRPRHPEGDRNGRADLLLRHRPGPGADARRRQADGRAPRGRA